MSLLLAKHYLILTDAEGFYLDAASFVGAAGRAQKMKQWRKEAKLLGKPGRQVIAFKRAKSYNLDDEPAKKGKKVKA